MASSEEMGERNGGVMEHVQEGQEDVSTGKLQFSAELLKDVPGLRIGGWTIQTRKCSILKMDQVERWGKLLGTTHLPEMVFGDSALELRHDATGIKIYFNPFDALQCWKEEGLPPVEVPAAAKWKLSRRPSQQIILDYDYTFTTPYCGSETIDQAGKAPLSDGSLIEAGKQRLSTSAVSKLAWVECQERIDMLALQARDPILFYDEVVLYEDELADNGISLLTVRVRVMPTCWFLLLRYWLRVDGVLMRLRDTRVFSAFKSDSNAVPVVLRERCQKEDTFLALASRGYPTDLAAYGDAGAAADYLKTLRHVYEKLVVNAEV